MKHDCLMKTRYHTFPNNRTKSFIDDAVFIMKNSNNTFFYITQQSILTYNSMLKFSCLKE
jgi:hypothetical protein